MTQMRKSRLNPVVGAARREVARVLENVFGPGTVAPTGSAPRIGTEGTPLILAAVSGGPDSLALASLLAHFNRRGDIRVGAVIVDHQLQTGSAEVAADTAQTLAGMGLNPVLVRTVQVAESKEGPEMAARLARYGAFEQAASETGAHAVALGHTLDDQAETVLLGLARGSGTRSLAGMPVWRQDGSIGYLRPLLALRRTDIEEICRAEELEPWRDPTNTDQSLMRAKVRHSILPYLEEHLGGGVALSLARTAAIAGADSTYLDRAAREELENVLVTAEELASTPQELAQRLAPALATPFDGSHRCVFLDRATLVGLHPALRTRVLALALAQVGGQAVGFERLAALEAFTQEHSVAGPLQLPGHVQAYRRRPGITLKRVTQEINLKKTGLIVLLNTAP